MNRLRGYFCLFFIFISIINIKLCAADFSVSDHIGRNWDNELVSFALTTDQSNRITAGQLLYTADSTPVRFQTYMDGGVEKIAFITDCNAFSTVDYSLIIPGTQPTASDLQVVDTGTEIQMFNTYAGVTFTKGTLTPNINGPISSLRTRSGKWIGGSILKTTARTVQSYTATVVHSGPVWAEVLCTITFDNGSIWKLRAKLQAEEPVVIFEEETDLNDDQTQFVVTFKNNFIPQNILYRNAMTTDMGKVEGVPIANISDSDPLYKLVPWLYWNSRPRQGVFFGLYGDSNNPDFVGVGAYRGDIWVDPTVSAEDRAQGYGELTVDSIDKTDVRLSYQIKTGARRWLIAMPDKTASLAPLSLPEADRYVCPSVQKSVIKHGNFPLDVVKDYVLQWTDTGTYPRVHITPDDILAIQQSEKFHSPYDGNYGLRDVAWYRDNMTELYGYCSIQSYPEWVGIYYDAISHSGSLATGQQLGANLCARAVEWADRSVAIYLEQEGNYISFGFAPHNFASLIMATLSLADVALGTNEITPVQRDRLKSQIAFLAYVFPREDYWSVERGFAAQANMTSTVFASQALYGSLLSGHPLGSQWVNDAMTELYGNELQNWFDSNGGGQECPAYAVITIDVLLSAFLAANKAGLNNYIFNSKMKLIAQWLSKIATPPDSRMGNLRHQPLIGNTWTFTPTSLFGDFAYLWKDQPGEASFAGQMQWMYEQQGKPSLVGWGGFSPYLVLVRKLLTDVNPPTIEVPVYSSELWPDTGVILRNGFLTAGETRLHMIINSRSWDHFDYDNGSVTIWGKGRIVADDWGYGPLAIADHNRLEASNIGNNPMIVDTGSFVPDTYADYVKGVAKGNYDNFWSREVVFVKDTASYDRPNYFVISDRNTVDCSAIWRMHFEADSATINDNLVSIDGKEDVDTELYFLQTEALSSLTSASKTKSVTGLDSNLTYSGARNMTQLGVIAGVNSGYDITAVVYPRLSSQNPPQFTTIADGQGVIVDTDYGRDYVFLADTPIRYSNNDVYFEGTVGVAQVRGSITYLTLPKDGYIESNTNSLGTEGSVTIESAIYENLVAYWGLEEASWTGAAEEVLDRGGNDIHGMALNNVNTISGGKLGSCGSFDGVDDRVQTPSHENLKYKGGDMTISFWVKLDSEFSANGTCISKLWNSSQHNWRVKVASNRMVYFYLAGASSWWNYTPGITLDVNVWNHIVINMSSDSTVRFYVNGNMVREVSHTITDWTPSGGDTDQPLFLGNAYSWTSEPLKGCLDEVAVWSRSLWDDEITSLYNNGSGLDYTIWCEPLQGYWRMEESAWTGTTGEVSDSSINSNHGKAINSATTMGDSQSGRYGVFDGVDDFVQVPSYESLKHKGEDMTISFWIKLDSEFSANGTCMSKLWNNSQYNWRVKIASNRMVYFYLAGASSWWNYTPGTTLDVNVWNHVVITMSSDSTVCFYVNGNMVREVSHTITDWTPSGGDTDQPLFFGNAYSWTSEPLKGCLDEVAVWTEVLSANKIIELWNNGSNTPLR